jgi:cytochrome c
VGGTRGPETRGSDTLAQVAAASPAASVAELARGKGCLSCHGVDKRIVGPSFKEVAGRYKGRTDAEALLLEKLRKGSSGAWGPIPMPANQDLADPDARRLIQWVLGAV